MHTNDLVGIPFEDVNCYELVRLYQLQRGIELPSFKHDPKAIRMVFNEYLREISKHWQIIQEPEPHCGIAMAYNPQYPRLVTHFGVLLENGKVLHSLEGIGSHLTDYDNLKYCIKGLYRCKI